MYGDKGYQEVKETVSTTLNQARRMNAPRAIALSQSFNGALEFQAGNWSEAEEALRESIRLYREIGAASGEAISCQRLGMLLTARGQLDEGVVILEEGVSASERAVMRAHCLTRIYAAMARNRLAAGEVPAADLALTLGLDMSDRHGSCITCDALLLPVAVSVRLAQGTIQTADSFCQQLEDTAAEYGSRIWVAMARQARGEVAEAQSELDQALNCYKDAHQAYQEAGYSYEMARCLDASARIYIERGKSGDVETAQESQREAYSILKELKAN